jgi:exopolysaccharide production protein ExoZ
MLRCAALPLVASANFDAWRVILFGAPCALIIYWLAAAELRSPPRPWPILVRLGDWSYATYLVHVLVVAALARILK